MCMNALAGWVDFEGHLERHKLSIDAMSDALTSRGGAKAGLWRDPFIAMWQAAAPVTAASPAILQTAEGTLAAAFSGHIDNLATLAKQLKFDNITTINPAQVLLAAYLKWGDPLAEALDGMFAFAVWDGRKRKLLLGRDRMGMQPLYYFLDQGGIMFGSEPKVLLASGRLRPRLNLAGISIALQPRLAMPGETQLRDLHEVPAATVLVVRNGSTALSPYWKLQSQAHTDDFNTTARRVGELLDASVRAQINSRPGVHVATMLSGGLDSSSVTALSMRALRDQDRASDLHSYCIHFDEDESSFAPSAIRPDIDSPYAQLCAAHIGSQHQTVHITRGQIAAALTDARRARDLPGWGQMDASMLILFRTIRRQCGVALTGEIADELFGGYPQYFDAKLVNRAQFPWLDEGPRLGSYLSKELFPRYDPHEDETQRYQNVLAQVPRLPGEEPGNACMREVLYVSMAGRLAVLLDRMDRMSMFAGVQVRFPFCEHRLVEYVWNVPWALKTHQGMKGLLKEAMRDLLPESTLSRKKSAYPHIQDSGYDQALADEAIAILDDRGAALAPLFDKPRLRQFLQDMREQGRCKRESHVLVQLIELERWMHSYDVTVD